MKATFRMMVGLGLVALLAAPPAAQAQGRGRGGMMGLGQLLGNSGVQKELKLDDQQIEKAKEVAAKSREKAQEAREQLQGLDQDERRTKMQQLNHEMNASALKAAGEFLKPDQLTRLKQINNQIRGAQAFSDPEIQKKLNLSDSQKSDIQTIAQESQQEMRTIFQENQDDREAAMKKMAELRKTTLTKVEGKLNDEQQKTWKELIGAPFEYKPDETN